MDIGYRLYYNSYAMKMKEDVKEKPSNLRLIEKEIQMLKDLLAKGAIEQWQYERSMPHLEEARAGLLERESTGESDSCQNI